MCPNLYFSIATNNYSEIVGEKSYSFQIVEVLPQVLLIFCLIFIHFELGVAYQSVAYKKNVYFVSHKQFT